MEPDSLPIVPAHIYVDQLREIQRRAERVPDIRWKWQVKRPTFSKPTLVDSVNEIVEQVSEGSDSVESLALVIDPDQLEPGGTATITDAQGTRYDFFVRLGVNFVKRGKKNQSYVSYNPEQGHSIELAAELQEILKRHKRLRQMDLHLHTKSEHRSPAQKVLGFLAKNILTIVISTVVAVVSSIAVDYFNPNEPCIAKQNVANGCVQK